MEYLYLCGAYLRSANLSSANLSGADLSYADLSYADLYLAHDSFEIPATDMSAFEFYPDDDRFVIGYRTKKSTHYGNTVYQVNEEYEAPIFSTRDQECDSGIYAFPTEKQAREWDSGAPIVKIIALRSEGLHRGDKYRFRRVLVVEDLK